MSLLIILQIILGIFVGIITSINQSKTKQKYDFNLESSKDDEDFWSSLKD